MIIKMIITRISIISDEIGTINLPPASRSPSARTTEPHHPNAKGKNCRVNPRKIPAAMTQMRGNR